MRAALLLAFALLASPAYGQSNEGATGHALLKHCQAANQAIAGGPGHPTDELLMQGVCLGEIYATVRILQAQQRACVPTTISTRDLLRSTIAFLSLKPEDLSQDFVDLVSNMVVSMWPCQGGARRTLERK